MADIAVNQPGVLTYVVRTNGYVEMNQQVMGNITVMGGVAVTSVTVNGSPHAEFSFSPVTNQLDIYELGLVANLNFTVEWV